MYCPSCGKPNPDGANFCAGCGTHLPNIPGHNTADSDMTRIITSSSESKPKAARTVPIVLIIVLLLGIAATVGILLTRGGAKSTGNDTITDTSTETEAVTETGAVQSPDKTPDARYPGQTSNSDTRFQSFDWLTERKVTAADLAGLSAGDLRLLRNAIFAMHGYKFKSADLQEYFSAFPWYNATYSDVTAKLSPTEKANVETIQKHEGKSPAATTKATTSEAGGSKSKLKSVTYANDYSDVVCYVWLDRSDLATIPTDGLRILRNTIYARHGRRFKDPYLQSYFNAMDWYRPTCNEVPLSALSATEKHNIQLIQSLER